MIGNTIKTTILLSTLAALFIGLGATFGGKIGMIIGLTIALALNFSAFWFSDKVVLKMHKAKQVTSGNYFEMVCDLARRNKMPIPKVFIINMSTPNAFATGRSPKHASVACSQSLMDILTHEELSAVMAHELTHVKNRDTLIQTIAVTIASAVAFVAEMLQWMAIFGIGGNNEEGNDTGSIVGMIAIMILAPLIASIIQLAISRQREFMADRGAAKLMRSGMPLITALQKLELASTGAKTDIGHSAVSSLYIINPFKASAIAQLFSTHPSTAKRVAALKKYRHQ
jgi:heat shock protein HtpX